MTARATEKTPPSHPAPAALQEVTVTHNYALGRPFHIRVTPDGSTVLYLRSDAEDAKASLYAYDVPTKKNRLLLSAESLLSGAKEKLSVAEKAMRERKRIKTSGFTGFALSNDGKRLVLKLSGKVWLHDLASGRSARALVPDGVVINPRLSPDGKRLAFVRDNNLYVMKLGTLSGKKGGIPTIGGKVVALTKGGNETKSYGLAEFVAQEEMSRYSGFWWSPDSKALIFQSSDVSKLEQFTIADAAAPEKSALVFPYPRPGRKNAVVRLYTIGVNGKGRREIKWDRKRFPYVTRVNWSKNAPPTVIVQSREQQAQQYLRVIPASGRTIEMFGEKDDAWLNISDSTPRWIDGKSYLWATEESGAWQLERHWPKLGGTKGGLKKRQVILTGDTNFNNLVHVDTKRGLVWFSASPRPVNVELFRAPLDASRAPVRVSPSSGEYLAAFASNGSTFVLTRASLDDLPRSSVHRVDDLEGSVEALAPYETGGAMTDGELPFVAKKPKKNPRVELVEPKRADGFYASIVRPRDFDAKKKYPVILYVYGGPGFTVVKANMQAYFIQQWMADHGFVVVSLDGRGTPRRGRAHERAIREKFGDVPLEDQVRGLTALGRHYAELDMDRVGVYGWSFGGYMSALAVMRRPDVFKVAVSGAPVVDWRYYDTHYTERFLGLPEARAKAYESSSLLTYAGQLERPLLLVHGIADDNVYFAHTLQLADHLFREGRHYELLPLVGLTHQVSDPQVRETLYRRMVSFLGEALW